MGKGRRVRQQRQAAQANKQMSTLLRESLHWMQSFTPTTVREALTTGPALGPVIPESAIEQAERLDAVLTGRGWAFNSRGCGIGGQLSWNYPPSLTTISDEEELWDISTITIDVTADPDSEGTYIDSATTQVALVGADPYADEAWIVPPNDLENHLATIEQHRRGDPDPFPHFRVLGDNR